MTIKRKRRRRRMMKWMTKSKKTSKKTWKMTFKRAETKTWRKKPRLKCKIKIYQASKMTLTKTSQMTKMIKKKWKKSIGANRNLQPPKRSQAR
jgi:hypothetical protein